MLTYTKNRILLVLMISIFSLAQTVPAISATSTTENFEDIIATFDVFYTDSTGLKWSKKLDGTYTNGCIGANGTYDFNACSAKTMPNGTVLVGDDSAAVQACAKAGGRLPTIDEYERMRSDFSSVRDLYTTFTDNPEDEFLWTASLYPSPLDIVFGRIFWGFSPNTFFCPHRANEYAVRCVGR